jgi:hypothetical protein
MLRVILSTIGTSLLTQQIKRDDPTENNWYNQLRDTANTTRLEMPPAIAVFGNEKELINLNLLLKKLKVKV